MLLNKLRSINFRKHTIELAFLIAVVAMIMIMGFSSKVYATVEYWALNVGDETVAVLNSESNAKAAIDTIEEKYKVDGTENIEVRIDPVITIEKKSYKVNSDAPEVIDVNEAVDKILTGKDGASYVNVTTLYDLTEDVSVDFETTYEETTDLRRGVQQVKQEGTAGVDTVTSRVTAVNGTIQAKDEISREVKVEPVNQIIIKGTGSRASGVTSSPSEITIAPGSATGQNVASFAMQFVGNPYVYGGSSLTDGADCSGFTMAVFANYGISLPHGAVAQRSYGTSVGTDISNAQAGDLMCFAGHVGIYVGDGKMVHASQPRTGIIITPISYSGKVVDIRRLV